METFTKRFGGWLLFVYHCFDRIFISGYLMGLQRPGQVVYWLQQVLGIEAITKEVLSKRTMDYVRWVEAYARKRKIPMEWPSASSIERLHPEERQRTAHCFSR
jgi:hypothetical protein